eukprot:2112015-Prymnesium_polylepis.1
MMPSSVSISCVRRLFCPSCSDLSHLISVRSQFVYLTISHMDLQLPNQATGVQRSDIVHIID